MYLVRLIQYIQSFCTIAGTYLQSQQTYKLVRAPFPSQAPVQYLGHTVQDTPSLDGEVSIWTDNATAVHCYLQALKLSSIGLRSGEYGGRSNNTHPTCTYVSIRHAPNRNCRHMSNTCGFKCLLKVLALVNQGIVEYQNTSRLRIRVHLGKLPQLSDFEEMVECA